MARGVAGERRPRLWGRTARAPLGWSSAAVTNDTASIWDDRLIGGNYTAVCAAWTEGGLDETLSFDHLAVAAFPLGGQEWGDVSWRDLRNAPPCPNIDVETVKRFAQRAAVTIDTPPL